MPPARKRTPPKKVADKRPVAELAADPDVADLLTPEVMAEAATPPPAEDVEAKVPEPQFEVPPTMRRTYAPTPGPEAYREVTDGEVILVHILEDGFTAFGSMWYRGQEIEVTVGSPDWNRTVDRLGNSWLAMTDDEQRRRYGSPMFGAGPWPFDTYVESAASQAEAERRRKPPPA